MYNPYQQNPYNPYLGQMNPYSWSLQPSDCCPSVSGTGSEPRPVSGESEPVSH